MLRDGWKAVHPSDGILSSGTQGELECVPDVDAAAAMPSNGQRRNFRNLIDNLFFFFFFSPLCLSKESIVAEVVSRLPGIACWRLRVSC